MDVISRVQEAIAEYDILVKEIEILSYKDGIIVSRLYGSENYVIKIFMNEYVREIKIYELFQELGIETIRVVDFKSDSILLDDIESNDNYRLATAEDMKNSIIIDSLAKWYNNLHRIGRTVMNNKDLKIYSEIEEVTEERLIEVRNSTGYADNEFWSGLIINLEWIKSYVKEHQTLNYNDFNYTNPHIPKEMQALFKEKFNFDEIDVAIDDVLGHIITLMFAYRREVFPSWAYKSLEMLKEGKLTEKLTVLLRYNETNH